MAYAALVSLAQVLDQILDHDQYGNVLHEQQHIKPLHENVILLSTFLEDFPEEAVNLEARITIAANKAEDIIEAFDSLKRYRLLRVLDAMSMQVLPSPDLSLSSRFTFAVLPGGGFGISVTMACYAALVSLAQVLDQILDHDQHAIVLHEQQQIKSLHENVILLSTFLEDFPGEAVNLEARITIAANKAEDIIEYHILDEISPKYGCFKVLNCLCQVILSIRNSVFAGSSRQRLYEELRKSIEEIESISKEAMRIKNKNSMSINHPSGSGPSSPRHAHNKKATP
ncbi:hypothetical protein DH2020_013586 [Rehmannia glutinosa]|uniref:Uncharacterized protein n=1 Tax=Rehmannia glutinosa TaxID=99300 RepID=A0ABR0X2N7_REHGL